MFIVSPKRGLLLFSFRRLELFHRLLNLAAFSPLYHTVVLEIVNVETRSLLTLINIYLTASAAKAKHLKAPVCGFRGIAFSDTLQTSHLPHPW